jgi:secondary thiamine-phosphate synthase enzyme
VIKTATFSISSRGQGDIHDITEEVAAAVAQSRMSAGNVTVFCSSSTSSVTTIEYESGAVRDLQQLFDEIVPSGREYAHNAAWGDGNGHSHVRAALLGASLTVPFIAGRLALGTWQQIVHVDFDNRPRRREVLLQIMGE